jgi:hypothetical protein
MPGLPAPPYGELVGLVTQPRAICDECQQAVPALSPLCAHPVAVRQALPLSCCTEVCE